MRLAFPLMVIVTALVLLLLIATTDSGGQPPGVVTVEREYQNHGVRWWARRAVQARKDANARKHVIRRLRAQLERDTVVSPVLAIRLVFGGYADQALRVAWCESRWDAGARNGQYRGLFQLGSWERSRYGHSSDPLTQARAAYAYFVDAGRDWSPWDPVCRP